MDFCDYNCRHAGWPREEALDGAGSCRTFQAVYCGKKGRHVHKNMPCPEKETGIDETATDSPNPDNR